MVRHCLWKMSATPGACIKPGLVRRPLCHKVNLPSCVAWRPLCHKVNSRSCVARQPLCHKVNLPRCEAWRRHLIMTCNIGGGVNVGHSLGPPSHFMLATGLQCN